MPLYRRALQMGIEGEQQIPRSPPPQPAQNQRTLGTPAPRRPRDDNGGDGGARDDTSEMQGRHMGKPHPTFFGPRDFVLRRERCSRRRALKGTKGAAPRLSPAAAPRAAQTETRGTSLEMTTTKQKRHSPKERKE